MLETLAGRLMWEPTVEGIRVEIPARRSWTILINVVWLIAWCGAGWLAQNRMHHSPHAAPIPWIWLVGWAAGVPFVTASILWSLTGRTTLALSPRTLEITRQMMGLQLGARSVTNKDARNLRFVPAVIRGRATVPSHISFEEQGRTRSFASAITEAEAVALIDKMEETYNFPKGLAR